VYCFNNTKKILEPICDLALDLAWSASDRSRKALGGGAMMTEFGAVGSDPVSLQLLGTVLDAAEERLQSWAYWNFKSYDDITTAGSPASEGLYNPDGSVQTQKVRLLSRPFATAVAGHPIRSKFDSRTNTYTLSYNITEKLLNATTDIFINRAMYYPRGHEIQFSPVGVDARAESISNDGDRIVVKHGHIPTGTMLEVRVVSRH
jgi:hypothetical protein